MGILLVSTCRTWAETRHARWELPGAAGAPSAGSWGSVTSPTKTNPNVSAGNRRALSSAAYPGPRGPVRQPRCPRPCCGERARQQLFFLEKKTPNTCQTLPWKTVDYSTAVTDRRLALIRYMGKKVVPLSSIRFLLLICTIEKHRNPEQSARGLCCTGHFTSTSEESIFEGRSWF